MRRIGAALHHTTFAGCIGNTGLQLQAVTELRPHSYIGTPSLLKLLVEKAAETSADIRCLQKAQLGGEAFPPSLHDGLTARGVSALQSYGAADCGLIA